MKKIFYILLVTQLTVSVSYSQSGWVRQNLNPNEILSSVFFINENTGFIGACGNHSSGIYKTTNAGLYWFTVLGNIYGDLWSIFFLNNNTGFAAYQGSVLKTINSGENWSVVYAGNHILFSISFTSSDTGYACGKYNSILKSTNGGNNWFLLANTGGMHQDLYFINNNTGFIVSEENFVTKTTNGGLDWIRKVVGSYSRLYGVTFINSSTGFCCGWNGQYMCAFKTTNAGGNWTQTINELQGIINRMKFVNNQTGYAVGTAILKTTNTGGTWQVQQDLGYGELYSVYFVNELTGYACGIDYSNQKGVLYKTTTGGEPIGIQPISNEMPKQFVLQQNYPNPFNPSTKIKFEIPTPLSPPFSKGGRTQSGGFVTLTIYDILGREVAVLINEQLSPGVYEVEWNAANFASGVYFYRLTVNVASTPLSTVYSETKKMVLSK